jgi:hypothetical protein
MLEATTSPDGTVRITTDDQEVVKSLLESGLWHLVLTGEQIEKIVNARRAT